ncbi:hypothetical protein [Mesorhizobium silamurunense]|uniref:hypothetical protein n=1 Tax=Mesorhizobium silamurunense TaxID=499528 RepID=UPI00177F68F7|nr:hypothetical protein [Mesorhizobium silamurunense]
MAGAIVFYYEGVPLGPVRYIPLLGPALSGLVDGRVDREYAAGQLNERLVWQEKQRRAEIKKAAELKSMQAQIDAATQELADRERVDAPRIADLQQRIRDQKDEDNGSKVADTSAGACKYRSGIPARVSVGIDAIGRR